MNKEIHRYIMVFFITASIFALVFVVSSYFSRGKLAEINDIQNQIALDILSTETRYALLGQTSCEHIVADDDIGSTLSQELTNLARKLKFVESESGDNSGNLAAIKKQYSLLQIKDYILMQELEERCGEGVVQILYFHQSDCDDCRKQSLVLDKLSSEYPSVRIYWLDKDVSTEAMQTMVSLFNINTGPSIVLDDKVYEGYVTYDELLGLLPEDFSPVKEGENETSSEETDI